MVRLGRVYAVETEQGESEMRAVVELVRSEVAKQRVVGDGDGELVSGTVDSDGQSEEVSSEVVAGALAVMVLEGADLEGSFGQGVSVVLVLGSVDVGNVLVSSLLLVVVELSSCSEEVVVVNVLEEGVEEVVGGISTDDDSDVEEEVLGSAEVVVDSVLDVVDGGASVVDGGGGGGVDVVDGGGGAADEVTGSGRLGSIALKVASLLRLISLAFNGLSFSSARRPWMVARAHIWGPRPVLPSKFSIYHRSPQAVPVEPPVQDCEAAFVVGSMYCSTLSRRLGSRIAVFHMNWEKKLLKVVISALANQHLSTVSQLASYKTPF